MTAITQESVPVEQATEETAANIIVSAMKWSAAASIVPVPVLDIVALGAVQTRMVMDLSDLYGETASKQSARALVSVLLGSLFPGVAAGLVGVSLFKSAPVVGTLVGAGAMAGFGAAATYAIGKVFVKHFQGGGSIATFNPADVKDELAAEFKKSKSARDGA
jgi:uncharacterized protein (DUF697 family)